MFSIQGEYMYTNLTVDFVLCYESKWIYHSLYVMVQSLDSFEMDLLQIRSKAIIKKPRNQCLSKSKCTRVIKYSELS